MPHGPNETGHRILEALDDGPLPYAEVRDIVGTTARHFGSVLKAMKESGLVEHEAGQIEMLERGAVALEELRAGREFDPQAPTVRLFKYEPRRAA